MLKRTLSFLKTSSFEPYYKGRYFFLSISFSNPINLTIPADRINSVKYDLSFYANSFTPSSFSQRFDHL